jgi:MFS transporter, AAHS family, 4-hydroxybenzoate transporter
MEPEQSVDVARLIDERPLTAFNIILVAFSFLILVSDGYDISAIGFAAPQLLKAWQITDRAELVPVLTASLVGILVGSPLFGYVGDRYGRKTASVLSCLVFGIFTLAAAWAGSLSEMLVLRGLAGIGLGGLMPNMIALNGEYAPRRFRATLIIIMFCGITLGGAVPGLVSTWLVPIHGWPVIFVVGGSLPILLAFCAALWLPESVKFLALKPGGRQRAVKILARLAPGVAIGPETRLAIAAERVYSGFSPKYLFGDGMALITPLLWLCFALNLMGFYFLISWMPTLLTGLKVLSTSDAALATSLIQIGGTIGGFAVCRPMESRGFLPVAILFVAAIPCVGLIGYAAVNSYVGLMVAALLAGFCVLGLQFGLNAASAMIYPTSLRSNGSGWAFGVGRFGSILGPSLGGLLIKMQLPLPELFLAAAVPFVVGAIACLMLATLYARLFKGEGLGERHGPQVAVKPAHG